MRGHAWMTCLVILCATVGVHSATAQQAPAGCTSEQRPGAAQTLRCRDGLVIVAEDGAKFTLQSYGRGGVESVDLQSKAVLVDALTTIVGFGALLIASHQGLQSLGRVLVIGIASCTFTSLVLLPALLAAATWNRRAAGTGIRPSTGATGDSVTEGGVAVAGVAGVERSEPPALGEPTGAPDEPEVLVLRRRTAERRAA